MEWWPHHTPVFEKIVSEPTRANHHHQHQRKAQQLHLPSEVAGTDLIEINETFRNSICHLQIGRVHHRIKFLLLGVCYPPLLHIHTCQLKICLHHDIINNLLLFQSGMYTRNSSWEINPVESVSTCLNATAACSTAV